MYPVFESLVPVFLLIVIGVLLKRSAIISDAAWPGMERLSFYLFFPALLFVTLYKADISNLSASSAALGILCAGLIRLAGGVALRLPVRTVFSLSDPSYSSVYQGFTRWNGFIALAIVEKLYGAEALVIVAIALGAMVLPINVANVAVLGWLGEKEGVKPKLWREIVKNPIVLTCIAGTAMNLLAVPLPAPVLGTAELIGQVALPLGLILVGAGLRPSFNASETAVSLFTGVMKLIVAPAVIVGCCYFFGMRGQDLVIAAICGSVPTAMNAYILAREMGGDARLFASLSTFQAIASAITIPMIIYVTGRLFVV